LYGPPETGKSSLIAAIANYSKYDVYNLELTAFSSDDELMIALLDSPSRSLIVVEDIDCNKAVHDRSKEAGIDPKFSKVSKHVQKTNILRSLSCGVIGANVTLFYQLIHIGLCCFCRSHFRVY
jgi:hypothetical protein